MRTEARQTGFRWGVNDPIWRQQAAAKQRDDEERLRVVRENLRKALEGLEPWGETFHGGEALACIEEAARCCGRLRADGGELEPQDGD